MQAFPLCCHFVPLRPKYLPHNSTPQNDSCSARNVTAISDTEEDRPSGYCSTQQSQFRAVFLIPAMENIMYVCNNQQMHLYVYVQTRAGVLHQHVSVTLVTISRVFCNRNTNSVQTNVLKYKSNETPTWYNTVHILFLQGHSTCFGRKRPSSGVFKN